jgi:hypothetical protein
LDPPFHRPTSRGGPRIYQKAEAGDEGFQKAPEASPGASTRLDMRKAEIDALVLAHRGRARPVAFFHVLRQPTLDADDQAFLVAHVDELGASDLLRWRARCEEGFTADVIRQLARRAIDNPRSFQHEVLDLPKIEMHEHEWTELAELVKGQVPEPLFAGILARGGERPVCPLPTSFFTPRALDDRLLPLDEDDAAAVGEAIKKHGIDAVPIRDLLRARSAGKLDIGEASLLALALARASSPTEDWSAAAPDFLPALKDAVLEKARSTPRSAERANLLGWLETQDIPRAVLLPIALASMHEGPVSYGLVAWLSRQLATRAAWDSHGLTTLSALMAQKAFPEIGELTTVVWSEASRGDDGPPRGLLEAIQVAFAQALIEIVQAALGAGDERRALAALSALACLDPPSRVSRAVHELRRLPGASAEVTDLIAVNERLIKHSNARDASLEGVVAALHAIADAFG